jgi:tRNA(Ile)-lysidine synthase
MSGNDIPFTPARLLQNLRQFPLPGTYWVAFSGGADSTALLLALWDLRSHLDARVAALHVNHGLHPHADDWQRHCLEFCASKDIPLHTARIAVDRNSGIGLEAEARRRRYGIAQDLLEKDDILLTAHHSDDQAETVLLNLMRGSGVAGLAGMPGIRPLGDGWLARPLLAFSAHSLRAYLRAAGIDWIEDSGNVDEAYDRNFLRHSLMPVLEKRWARAAGKIALSAAHCREASGLLSGLADKALSAGLAHPRVLRLDSSIETDPARFKLILRRWLNVQSAPAMPARRLEELIRQCRRASPEHHVQAQWDGWVMQLYRRRLWLQTSASITDCPVMDWKTRGPLELGPVTGQLTVHPVEAGLPAGLSVAPRRGGEKIHFSKANLHRSVKSILQEASVPPWLRPSVPLLLLDGEPAALADWAIGSRLLAWLEDHGAVLTWKPAEPLLKLVHLACRAEVVDQP